MLQLLGLQGHRQVRTGLPARRQALPPPRLPGAVGIGLAPGTPGPGEALTAASGRALTCGSSNQMVWGLSAEP